MVLGDSTLHTGAHVKTELPEGTDAGEGGMDKSTLVQKPPSFVFSFSAALKGWNRIYFLETP